MSLVDTSWRETWTPLPDHRRANATGRRFVELVEGARGDASRRGRIGLARFHAGVYPACSEHGAVLSIGGGKWRCPVKGCNVGCEVAPATALHWQLSSETNEGENA